MVFIADDLGAWLVAALADASRKRLTTFLVGTEQERALRSAATAAVQMTANELRPDDDEQAEHLAQVIGQVFAQPPSNAPPAEQQATVLEALQAGIAGQLAVLDDASLTGTGRSSADVLEVPASVLAEKLTSYLLREIIISGSNGGSLFPLASQLNHDVSHVGNEQLKSMMGQVLEALARLEATGSTAGALTEPPFRPSRSLPAQLTQRTVPLSDGLHAGTLLAIEVQAHCELQQATVVMTGITGPPDAATIPPPARLYWHPARQISATIAQGASNLINVARAGPLPPGALMDTPDLDLPWTLPNGHWQIELQLTATGYPALLITATFNVAPTDGFPVQHLEWLTLTAS